MRGAPASQRPSEIMSCVRLHNVKPLIYGRYLQGKITNRIAGNVAENAGGGRAVKYGVTGRYNHGLEVVTPEDEVFQAGGKRVKDVTG